MFELSGDARWRDLFLDVVDLLWRHWEYDEHSGCHLWWTDLYGAREKRTMALHGSPRIVNSFATHLPPSDPVDDLLIAGGEPIWHTGPLVKMPSLCHGVPAEAP